MAVQFAAVTTHSSVRPDTPTSKLEMALAEDAQARGWANEQARHRSIADRVTRLLTDLGEPDGAHLSR